MCILPTVISVFRSAFRSRAAVELENFALRHQLNVPKRSLKHRPRLTSSDRLGRLFHVRFSGESRDISKCLSALAGLRHHPDSGKGTLEEIGHAV
jgi:hypothetical protein